jgi:hypothetical protein
MRCRGKINLLYTHGRLKCEHLGQTTFSYVPHLTEYDDRYGKITRLN